MDGSLQTWHSLKVSCQLHPVPCAKSVSRPPLTTSQYCYFEQTRGSKLCSGIHFLPPSSPAVQSYSAVLGQVPKKPCTYAGMGTLRTSRVRHTALPCPEKSRVVANSPQLVLAIQLCYKLRQPHWKSARILLYLAHLVTLAASLIGLHTT
jgi:hypothetical protein